jgi:hypothetical protein
MISSRGREVRPGSRKVGYPVGEEGLDQALER